MKLQYLSHSAFMLTTVENVRILIDPFLLRNELAPLKPGELKVEYIILTHAHGDHLGDTVEIAKQNDATVICVSELANYLSKKGIRTHAMQIGGAFRFSFGRVKLVTALHGSMTPDGVYGGLAAGVVIAIGDKTIYHCGDTGIFGDLRLIGELDSIDYMLVPIGGNYTMDIADAIVAVEMVKPRIAIPMHYNTFPVIVADPEVFAEGIRKAGRECVIMKPGETIEI
ncbi:MAG TPA: metal-dependent hydrolase [Candidatus Cloacimonadota bacterium]|nr:metal-dependent hydrolase [Candidatus Cloacimonadota bacterium]